jgi:aspartyl aminopeptidase
MTTADLAPARQMLEYIDASPSPYHACEETGARLGKAGFRRLSEVDAWDLGPGHYFVVRGGSLIAWTLPQGAKPATGFRIVGAHTDSPNLRVKPRPDANAAGFNRLGVEVYGGVLLNSWLDRDLGLSGRVFLRSETGTEPRLFKIDRPLLRIPQLAIHLNREIREKGLRLDKQRHMAPLWGLESSDAGSFVDLLARELRVQPDQIQSWEAMCHDTTPASLWGVDDEFVASGRLDNLCSSFCAQEALLRRVGADEEPNYIPVVSLFDHEEVGSTSRSGATGSMLKDLLERTVLARGGTREEYHRALADSVCVSADMAHATHPNYIEKHDPQHHLAMNAGPVIKINANLRYASEAETEALFQLACERADVPYQKWVNRSDLACGSTIGPVAAANLGVRTVDVGNPQLAMHSSRETCGSHDPGLLVRALVSFLE